jgi:hypothetical protein
MGAGSAAEPQDGVTRSALLWPRAFRLPNRRRASREATINGARPLVIRRRPPRAAFITAKSRMLSQIDKQILRSWLREKIDEPLARFLGRGETKKGPRIAVIGNCQSYGVAYAMKVMHPHAVIDHYSAVSRTRFGIRALCARLRTYDHVFSHAFPPGLVRGGDHRDIVDSVPNVKLYPGLVFSAFHPDLLYLLDETANHHPLQGATGPYHSALVVFAFHKGLSVDEARALFHRNVFEALGYFDVWDQSAAEFLRIAKNEFNLDFSNELVNWSRRGPFMYSIVHPMPFVMYDIARKILPLVGLAAPEVAFDHFAIDDLARSEVFPVYPPIAESFGARGAYLFKLANFHLSAGVGDFINLPEFIERSYKTYRAAKPQQLRHPRTDGWLSDAATSKRIVELARENLRAGVAPTV